MSTRTGPAVQKLVDGLQEDITEAVGYLAKGLELIRALQGETRGVNGLSPLLTGKGNELDNIIDGLTSECLEIEKKLLGTGRPEIVQKVDADLTEAVKAARGAA